MPGLTIAKSLNRAHRQMSIDKQLFNTFKLQLGVLYEQIGIAGAEMELKGDLMDFLKLTFYGQSYKVSPNGNIDCAIHLGSSLETPVGVIFEVKAPANTSEMITKDNLNRKALQELLLYYLRERVVKKNIQLKQLVVTNIYEFFIFDAQEFERVFYSDKKLLKRFAEFEEGTLTSGRTDFFYKEIAAEAIESVKGRISYTWFDIRKYKDFLLNGTDKRLVELYKIFSPEYLLKRRFQHDSYSLNTRFYNELLYIIGLEEVEEKESHKRIITRRNTISRNPASMLENTITVLDSEDWIDSMPERTSFGKDREEQIFNVALALVIGWINRVLFLKLLEAQLVKYHKGDISYAFLRPQFIPDYDELNKLFFQVLAKHPADRKSVIADKFGKIPYLNSSLFEVSTLERKTIRISSLDNSELPLYGSTILKDGQKLRYRQLPTLRYLLEFLDAYDFASEGSGKVQETVKTLINASVLGLIFEKLNGHKDGSVFTPGAITMYMSREAIQATIVRKFNEQKNWNCADYEALKDKEIDDFRQANAIVDSIRICDPAVGSGHFLVSVLNEIIRTKYDLGILLDCNGRRIKKQDWSIEIEKDELVVSDADGAPFVYVPGNEECQRIQEALFNEKRRIIENCLFGVDLNPNAVNICRLRLWIELLKNAYYTKDSGYTDLETLPNIDINIKVGNSLIHRFDLKQDISETLKKTGISINQYKDAVNRYKNAKSKDEKRELDDMISTIKSTLRTQISRYDPKILRKIQLEKELNRLLASKLFEISKEEQMQQAKLARALRAKISKLNDMIEGIRDNKMFIGAFEWRIEFPEILDETGCFVGFDCVIGNPPYIQLQKMGDNADALLKMGYKTYERTGDVYCLFCEMGMKLLKPHAMLSFITSNGWMKSAYGKSLRALLSEQYNPLKLIDFAGFKVFDSATVDVSILNVEKGIPSGHTLACSIQKETFDIENLSVFVQQNGLNCNFTTSAPWTILTSIEQSIKRKIEAVGAPLKEWNVRIYRGILTGCNEAFVIDSDKRDEILNSCITEDERKRTEELIRPILRGRDIKRYGYEWANKYLIATFPSRCYDIEQYPAVKQYLLSFGKERLEQTGKSYIVKGKVIKARKKTNNKWFELQDSISYWDEFAKPKIVWIELSDEAKFTLCDNLVPLNTVFFLTGDHLNHILGQLNSKLVRWYFTTCLGTSSGVGTNRWLKYTLEQLPLVRQVNEELELLVVSRLSDGMDITVCESKIDTLICRMYGLTQEESAFIIESCR